MSSSQLKLDSFRYILVGGFVFFLYFSLIYLFVDHLEIYYPISISISYVIAVVSHFSLNKIFTFPDSDVGSWHQVLRYMVVLCMNYGVTIGVVWLLVERFYQSPYLGACIGIVLTTATGFVASKYWVFAKKRTAFE